MFGKPMISSELGTGTSFVNIHELTGLVVPPSDPVAFRQAMARMIENPADAKRMGENAATRYQQYFRADQMTSKYIQLYQELGAG
jgi:glycosyltransferase involved in cell wall biosynthesis